MDLGTTANHASEGEKHSHQLTERERNWETWKVALEQRHTRVDRQRGGSCSEERHREKENSNNVMHMAIILANEIVDP